MNLRNVQCGNTYVPTRIISLSYTENFTFTKTFEFFTQQLSSLLSSLRYLKRKMPSPSSCVVAVETSVIVTSTTMRF